MLARCRRSCGRQAPVRCRHEEIPDVALIVLWSHLCIGGLQVCFVLPGARLDIAAAAPYGHI